jgi:predicted DNA-binding protein
MAAIMIHLPDEALERAKAIAKTAGRSVDEVVSEIATNALTDDELDDSIAPAFHAELARRIDDFENGRGTARPVAEVFAEIRARLTQR